MLVVCSKGSVTIKVKLGINLRPYGQHMANVFEFSQVTSTNQISFAPDALVRCLMTYGKFFLNFVTSLTLLSVFMYQAELEISIVVVKPE